MRIRLRMLFLRGRLISIGIDQFDRELLANLDTFGPYGQSVDVWAIGTTTLYALSPKTDITDFKTMTQDSIDENLGIVLETLSLSLDGQDFVRRCLNIDPNKRMTIFQARRHEWLKVKEHESKKWKRIRDSLWQTSPGISPPVEPLPEVLRDMQPQPKPDDFPESFRLDPAVPAAKRQIDDIEAAATTQSPFFSSPKPVKKIRHATNGATKQTQKNEVRPRPEHSSQ